MAYTTSMTSVVSYFVNCCFYIRTICRHFNLLIESIDQKVQQNHHEKDPMKIQANQRKFQTKLHEAIDVQVNVIE